MSSLSLDELNKVCGNTFATQLAELYEHSPWVVTETSYLRPFQTLESMQAAFESTLFGSPPEKQAQLIAAHPDLAAKLEEIASLTAFSQAEQAKAGFASLPEETLVELREALAAYRERFGHPFILCVSEHPADDVLPIMKTRSKASPESEHIACLVQIARIGWHRLTQLLPKDENTKNR